MVYRRRRRQMKKRPARQNLVRLVRNVVNKQAETKYHLITPAGGPGETFDNNIPYENHLTQVAVGTGPSARVGNQIKLTGMYGKLFLVNATGASPTTLCRVILYIPKEANDTLAGLSYYSPPDQDRFTILKEQFLTIGTNGVGASANIPSSRILNFKRKLRNTVQFSGSNGNDVSKNPIRIYMVSNTPDDISVRGFVYTYYKDM